MTLVKSNIRNITNNRYQLKINKITEITILN